MGSARWDGGRKDGGLELELEADDYGIWDMGLIGHLLLRGSSHSEKGGYLLLRFQEEVTLRMHVTTSTLSLSILVQHNHLTTRRSFY